MKFIKNATDAWFSYASAGAAACGAWQDRLEDGLPAAPVPAAPANLFSWWTDMFLPRQEAPAANPFSWWMDTFMPRQGGNTAAAMPAALPDFGAGFFQFAQPFASFSTPSMARSAFAPSQAMSAANSFADMMQAWGLPWPRASWNMCQMPMTAWLMSSGLPYAVAEPTARGNAASMEAADAAREGMNRAFSAFRTDGGHASASLMETVPKLMMLFMAPWLMVSMQGLTG